MWKNNKSDKKIKYKIINNTEANNPVLQIAQFQKRNTFPVISLAKENLHFGLKEIKRESLALEQ